jgi:nitroreductase
MAGIHPLQTLRRLRKRLEAFSRRAGTKRHGWAAFYYSAVSSEFAREQMSVLAGRCAYESALKAPQGSMAMLRRNVHRIEKGLLMRPRRLPFAVDYIGETVDAYSVSQECQVDEGELSWAGDVLTEYFRVHDGEASIQSAKMRFEATSKRVETDRPALIPYTRDLSGPPPVEFDSLMQLARQRRSVRWFRQEPVPRSEIDRAITLGCQAPSACNRQPFHFRVFDDRDMIARIAEIPYGMAGYEHNVPVLVVVLGQQRNFFHERDRHLIYIDSSLAVMGFILALETLGLSSCCINWPDIPASERRLAEVLQLSPDERAVMLIAVGYPDVSGLVACSAKKSIQNLRRYNFE